MFNASADEEPDWVRSLKENAVNDPELAALLAAADGDPAKIEARLKSEMDTLHARITGEARGTGEEAPPQITFKNFDPFDLWVWMELYAPPSGAELEMVQEVVNSWFMLGRLGAFNSANLQVMYSGTDPGQNMEYDVEAATSGLDATMHDMTAVEAQGHWVRFWVDMGTADEMSLDVLINALVAFSREHVGLRQVNVGGENEDWPTPDAFSMRPEVSMDPMRGPSEW
jgi:hypothetical protein